MSREAGDEMSREAGDEMTSDKQTAMAAYTTLYMLHPERIFESAKDACKLLALASTTLDSDGAIDAAARILAIASIAHQLLLTSNTTGEGKTDG